MGGGGGGGMHASLRGRHPCLGRGMHASFQNGNFENMKELKEFLVPREKDLGLCLVEVNMACSWVFAC